DTARGLLAAYHKANPLHAGMKSAESRQKLVKNTDQTTADALIASLVRENVIKRAGERYALADFEIHYTKRQTAIRTKLLQYYNGAGIEPASVDEVNAAFAQNERADLKQVMDSVLTGGELVMLSPQICYSRAAYETVCAAAKAHFAQHDTITLAELRDALSTSRKYALAALEYFDKVGITKKEGDFRKLNCGFPEI
ncbi:MAG: SelB C-terminal domain-containing protein, partial [Clostridia bacterium]|nr:SelB C-terminal domain-containing protein [Clostridia bacterium]